MKTQPSDRIKEAFRSGKEIDSAIKRAATFAKKADSSSPAPAKRSPPHAKPVK